MNEKQDGVKRSAFEGAIRVLMEVEEHLRAAARLLITYKMGGGDADGGKGIFMTKAGTAFDQTAEEVEARVTEFIRLATEDAQSAGARPFDPRGGRG